MGAWRDAAGVSGPKSGGVAGPYSIGAAGLDDEGVAQEANVSKEGGARRSQGWWPNEEPDEEPESDGAELSRCGREELSNDPRLPYGPQWESRDRTERPAE